jgi:general secretion pathway protein I
MKLSSVQNGFTLIEVMVALSVVAIGLMATIKAINEEINNAVITRNKMLGLWILENKVAEIRLNPVLPANGVNQGKETLINQTWYWQTNAGITANAKIHKVEVSVSDKPSKDFNDSLIKQSIYLSDLR